MNKNNFFSCVSQNTAPISKGRIPFYCRSVGHRIVDKTYNSKLTPSYYEFVWTIDGTGTVKCNNKTFYLNPNDIFIIPPCIEREFYIKDTLWHSRWFTVVGEVFTQLIRSFNLSFLKVMHTEYSLTSDFISLESHIKRSFISNRNEASVTVFRILDKSARKSLLQQNKSSTVGDAICLIENNLAMKNLNVDWISQKLKSNRSHLSRIFKSEVGTPPSEYIAARRIQMAADFLKNSNQKISDIAELCGFSDSNYFSRQFKQQTGVSPKTFRLDKI